MIYSFWPHIAGAKVIILHGNHDSGTCAAYTVYHPTTVSCMEYIYTPVNNLVHGKFLCNSFEGSEFCFLQNAIGPV